MFLNGKAIPYKIAKQQETAMETFQFDATRIAPNMGTEALPAGWYDVAIVASELKPTRDTMGAYFEFKLKVLQGQYSGKTVIARCNVKNVSEEATNIGLGQLSAISHAVGVLQWSNVMQLHDRPFKVKLKVRKDPTGQYDDQNEPTAYREASFQPNAVAGATSVINTNPIMPQGIAIPPSGAQLMPPAMPPQAPQMPPNMAGMGMPQGVPPTYNQPPQMPPVTAQQAPAQPWPQPQQAQPQPAYQPPQQPPQQAPQMPPAIDPAAFGGMPPFNMQQAPQQMPQQPQQAPQQAPAVPPEIANMVPPWMQQPQAPQQ